MTQVFLIAVIVAAVVAGNILARHVPMIPLPFFLILLGIILSFIPIYHGFALNPSVFTLAIISPLLFNEAQNSSRLWIGRSIGNIISLAVGLVIITVLVVGLSLHALFAVLPLSLAFALIAIVTPTDASAVNSIFEANPIAREQMGILKNESLFNDAAGIVAFDMALEAYISGQFSLNIAVWTFLWEFLGGLIFGAVLGVAIVSTRMFLIHYHDDTPLIMVTIQLLSPFLVYLLAQGLGLSGILAVVAAGLVQGSERERLRLTSARMQLVTTNVWEIVSGLLSGVVFVLLGLVTPSVGRISGADSHRLLLTLLLVGIITYAITMLIRIVWSRYLVHPADGTKHGWRDGLVMALSGAHGTITLSLAFSMPTVINGHLFVYRSQMIFVAAIVIFISLIMPTIFIPILTPAKEEPVHRFRWVRRMLQAGIRALLHNEGHRAEAELVIDTLQQQLILDATPSRKIQRQLLNQSQAVEEKTIHELYSQGKITADEEFYYNEFIRLNNFSADNKVWKNIWLRIRFSFHIGRMYKDMHQVQEAFLTAPVALEEVYWRRQFESHGADIIPIERAGFNAVMDFLDTQTQDNRVEVILFAAFIEPGTAVFE